MSLLTQIAANSQLIETPSLTDTVNILPVCNGNVKRFGLGFSNTGTNPITFTTLSAAPGGGGIVVDPGTFRWITAKDYGCMPQLEWYAQVNGFANPFSLFELIFPGE